MQFHAILPDLVRLDTRTRTRSLLLAVGLAGLLGICVSCAAPVSVTPEPTAGSYGATGAALGVPGRLPGLEDVLVDALLDQMTLDERVGQLLFMSFEFRDDGTPVTEFTETEATELLSVRPGGVVLYGMNIRELDQTAALVSEIAAASPFPPIIATDHEGGLVARLNTSGLLPATDIPRAITVGTAGERALAYSIGAVIGAELRSLGIVMNFAPVADVDTGETGSVLGRHGRAYGTSPTHVAQMSSAVIAGMQDAGVSAVVKHFPGHGGASADSHDAQATVAYGIERLRGVDLVPFRSAIATGVDGIMTAHIAVPALTGTDLPATLSPRIVSDLLRQELGYDGVVISDALNMRGLARHFPEDELAVRVITAGSDVVLKPFDALGARDAILAAVEADRLTEARIAESAGRVIRLKLRRGLIAPFGTLSRDPTGVLGAEAHQNVVQQIREAAAQ